MNLENIINLKFSNGMLIWSFYRATILMRKNEKENQYESQKIKRNKIIQILNLIKGLKYIFFKKRKIFLFSTAMLNFKNGERYKNILDDYYYEIFPNDTQIFENPDIYFNWRTPREKNFSTINMYMYILAIILGKIFPLRSNKADIKIFCEEMEDISFYSYKKVREIERRIFWLEKIYKLFFKITTPKLILFNCASYGGINSVMLKIAKELGIKTGEIQHGIISKGHVVYHNITLKEKEVLKDYMPDYFLTFGEYWNNQIKIPTKIISIGNPNINNYLANKKIDEIKKDIDYLIISQWTITNKMIDLAINLRKLKLKEKICFKLHPAESLTKEQLNLLKESNIEICNNKYHIYYFLEKSKNIVGDYSTTLIEGIVFNANIFIYDNKVSRQYIPEGIGIFFKDVKEIAYSYKKIEVNSSYYWDKNFKENYNNFLKEIKIFSME